LPPLPRLRWLIIGLVFLATLINFIDRLTVSVLAPVIVADLHLSNQQYAGIATWFLIAYSASHALSGRVYDRIGIRRGFASSITLWSLAAMAHAAARSAGALSAFRFLLGLGEAGNWPGAAKVCAEWFPVRERAFAMAIFNSGAALGSVIAPPFIVFLQLRYGWQATFLVTGSLGFLWLAAWLWLYQPPGEHRWLTPEQRSAMGAAQVAEGGEKMGWRQLLGFREVWAIVLGRFFTDPVWWLYLTWLPLYLNKVHGVDLKGIAWMAAVPYISADIGSLLGGAAAGWLIARGWSVDKARKAVILIGALFMMGGIGVFQASTVYEALFWISMVTFGFQAWVNNMQTLPSDYFPRAAVGAVAGLGGLGAGIGAMLFTLLTGWIVDHFGYGPVLLIAGALPAAGLLALFSLGGKVRQLAACAALFAFTSLAQSPPFSHKLHDDAGVKLPCTFCHKGAKTEFQAGFPEWKTCKTCHVDKPERTIPSRRVYKVPDFVVWSHEQHALARIECATCHGEVSKQEILNEFRSTKMYACVNCHKENKATVRCNACHELGQ
jgi:MFS transporter, ACS family, hexuronate transporter